MLTSTSSALAMAENLLDAFISETQAAEGAPDVHQTPKAMAILNTTAISPFLEAWEILSSEMLTILTSDNDPNFYAALSRARDMMTDVGGSLGEDTSIDVGYFLAMLDVVCDPVIGNSLDIALSSATSAYYQQFVRFETGNGTGFLTGMQMTWPQKDDYKEFSPEYDKQLFGENFNQDIPQWMGFLGTFLNATTPTQVGETTVCSATMASALEPAFEGQLLLNPSLEFDPNTGAATVSSEVPISTDMVFVSYGVNLTHALFSRRLQEKLTKAKSSRAKDPSASQEGQARRSKRRLSQSRRKVQADGDYFFMYGGDVAVKYEGPLATAVWDGLYYVLVYPGGYEHVYVNDLGGDLRSFPVCYFSKSNPRTASDLIEPITSEEAIASLGCIEGYVSFTTDLNSTGLTLYIQEEQGNPREVRLEEGGQIAPILDIDLSLGGETWYEYIGGYNETIVDWSYDNGVGIIPVLDSEIFDIFGAQNGVIVMGAADFDVDLVDSKLFTYSFTG
jgi:hypothetical protein